MQKICFDELKQLYDNFECYSECMTSPDPDIGFQQVVVSAADKSLLSAAVAKLRAMYADLEMSSSTIYKNKYTIPQSIDDEDKQLTITRLQEKYTDLLIKYDARRNVTCSLVKLSLHETSWQS